MSVSPALPPSERDFQVYERVVLEGASTRQAASEFSLSQTRVRQLVERMNRWLTETLPTATEIADASHLHLARHIAADRLQYLYRVAMHGWRTTSQSKYAGILIRVINAQSKLPVIAGTLEALAADAAEDESPDDPNTLARNTLARSASEGNVPSTSEPIRASKAAPASNSSFTIPPSSLTPPLPRDCSLDSKNSPPAPVPPPAPPAVTPMAANPSASSTSEPSAARRAFFTPAQQPLAADEMPVTQLKITPAQLGLSISKPLSRKERRRLRRAHASK
jgi:hypothetical protein